MKKFKTTFGKYKAGLVSPGLTLESRMWFFYL